MITSFCRLTLSKAFFRSRKVMYCLTLCFTLTLSYLCSVAWALAVLSISMSFFRLWSVDLPSLKPHYVWCIRALSFISFYNFDSIILSYSLEISGRIAMVLMLPTEGNGVASLERGMILACFRYFGTVPRFAQSWN